MVRQKSMTDLLGPFASFVDAEEGTLVKVDGRFIVTTDDAPRHRVLWAFESNAQALRAFEAWQKGG